MPKARAEAEAEARAEQSPASGETAVERAPLPAPVQPRQEELPKLNLDDGFMQMLNGNQ